MISQSDRTNVRDAAKRYREMCDGERNRRARQRYRDLNNLVATQPTLYCNTGLLADEIRPNLPASEVADPQLRQFERWCVQQLLHDTLGDDRVCDPWYVVRAEMFRHPEGVWGVAQDRIKDESTRGWRAMPVLRTMEDLELLKATEHRVIDAAPERAVRLRELVGDILPIHVTRSTVYPVWGGTDLSEAAGALFGLEEFIYHIIDEPQMVHRFMAFTRDAVLANLKQGEAAGDWSTADSWYYNTPATCDALPDAEPNAYGAKLKDLAWFSHAQEFDAIGPEHFEQFLFAYQKPILDLFGKVTYGCCDTLDTKLPLLRGLDNLGKIVSGPLSDPACYPEMFGEDCVISWRPVASHIASPWFDEQAQRHQLREGLAKLRGCQVEVFMHEPMTVQGDVNRIKRWVEIAREEAGMSDS